MRVFSSRSSGQVVCGGRCIIGSWMGRRRNGRVGISLGGVGLGIDGDGGGRWGRRRGMGGCTLSMARKRNFCTFVSMKCRNRCKNFQ